MTSVSGSHSPTQSRAHANALADRVQLALRLVTWPAHPRTLIDCAQQSNAGSEVIEALRGLPDEAFGSFSEVSASIAASQMSTNASPPDATPH